MVLVLKCIFSILGFKLSLTVRDSSLNSAYPVQTYYAFAAIRVIEADLQAKIAGGDRTVK